MFLNVPVRGTSSHVRNRRVFQGTTDCHAPFHNVSSLSCWYGARSVAGFKWLWVEECFQEETPRNRKWRGRQGGEEGLEGFWFNCILLSQLNRLLEGGRSGFLTNLTVKRGPRHQAFLTTTLPPGGLWTLHKRFSTANAEGCSCQGLPQCPATRGTGTLLALNGDTASKLAVDTAERLEQPAGTSRLEPWQGGEHRHMIALVITRVLSLELCGLMRASLDTSSPTPSTLLYSRCTETLSSHFSPGSYDMNLSVMNASIFSSSNYSEILVRNWSERGRHMTLKFPFPKSGPDSTFSWRKVNFLVY